MLNFMINLDKWNALPPAYQSIVKTSAAMAKVDILAKYDTKNPSALRSPVAANALYAEIFATSEDFKTIWASMEAFRNQANLWN